MRPIKLRHKILFVIMIGVLLWGVLFAIIFKFILSRQFSKEMEKMGVSVAQDIARQSVNFILLNDSLHLQTLINGYKRAQKAIQYIYITDSKNKILAHTFKEGVPGRLRGIPVKPEQGYAYSVKLLDIQGENIRDISVPILKGEIGIAHVGISEKYYNVIVNNMLNADILIALVVFIIYSIVGAFFSNIITKPVLELVKLVKAVSAGDLNRKITVESNDEIGELALAFNKMVYVLQTTTVSRKYLDNIFNSMINTLIIVDIKGKITDINRTALDLLGYKKEELLGRPISKVFFSENTGLLLEDVVVNNRVRNEEKIYLTKSNKKIPVSFSASVLCGRDDSDKAIVCVAQDIAHHKEIEDRITKINNCLLDFKINPDQNIKSLVSVCCRILEADCAIYHNISGVSVCSDSLWEIPAGFNILNNGEGHICYDVVKNGLDAVVMVSDLPKTPYAQTDPNVLRYNLKFYMGQAVKWAGEIVGSLCVVYKNEPVITEDDKRILGIICAAIANEEKRKKSEEELRNSYEELRVTQSQLLQKEKMASIGQLAGGVAHEINNPLTGVLNNVQLIRMMFDSPSPAGPAEIKELLDVVEESALRCKKITESLLDFSHASMGEFSSLSLNVIIEKVTGLIHNEMKLQNIVIKKELQPDLPDIKGDSQLLQQIIVNFISNSKWAIEKRFGKSGGLIILSTKTDPENKFTQLCISDNGIGIPQEKIGKIFEPFFTTKQVGVGTGLGLSIAAGVIRKHRGVIKVESEVNVGTTFTINFPIPEVHRAVA